MASLAIPSGLTLPPRTFVGRGCISGLVPACAIHGPRGLIVCSRSVERSGVLGRVLDCISPDSGILVYRHTGGEPTLATLEALLATARRHDPDWIAGIGGGSVLDIAKACAGLYAAPESPRIYHDGAAIPPSAMPFVAAPTTAGTGSEATIVAVLTNQETGVKKSIRHPTFMPGAVWLDADLLDACPAQTIAWSGMDAFTQAVESFMSRNATWFTDQLSLKAAELIRKSLSPVFAGDKGESSEALLVGSYLAGLALSNARLGLVHGLAHPLGTRYHAAHGHVCAICLPVILEFNMPAVTGKYGQLCHALGEDLLTTSRRLIRDMRISSPFHGRPLTDRAAIIEETLASGSTRANPRDVSARDVEQILDALFKSQQGAGQPLPG